MVLLKPAMKQWKEQKPSKEQCEKKRFKRNLPRKGILIKSGKKFPCSKFKVSFARL
jgi:hypothetical protein